MRNFQNIKILLFFRDLWCLRKLSPLFSEGRDVCVSGWESRTTTPTHAEAVSLKPRVSRGEAGVQKVARGGEAGPRTTES